MRIHATHAHTSVYSGNLRLRTRVNRSTRSIKVSITTLWFTPGTAMRNVAAQKQRTPTWRWVTKKKQQAWWYGHLAKTSATVCCSRLVFRLGCMCTQYPCAARTSQWKIKFTKCGNFPIWQHGTCWVNTSRKGWHSQKRYAVVTKW